MRFTFILAIFSFLSFGLLATTNPIKSTGVEERQIPEAYAIFQTLKGQTDTILPQITALKAHNDVTYDNVAPLINKLISDINTATSSIKALPPSSRRELIDRQSGDQLADLVAGIVEAIVNALDELVGDLASIPLLAGLLSGVDAALANLLHGLEGLLAEVLLLVAQLLKNIAKLLQDLAFDLTLAALGF